MAFNLFNKNSWDHLIHQPVVKHISDGLNPNQIEQHIINQITPTFHQIDGTIHSSFDQLDDKIKQVANASVDTVKDKLIDLAQHIKKAAAQKGIHTAYDAIYEVAGAGGFIPDSEIELGPVGFGLTGLNNTDEDGKTGAQKVLVVLKQATSMDWTVEHIRTLSLNLIATGVDVNFYLTTAFIIEIGPKFTWSLANGIGAITYAWNKIEGNND